MERETVSRVASEFRNRYQWYAATDQVRNLLDHLSEVLHEHREISAAGALAAIAAELEELPPLRTGVNSVD